MSRVLLPESGRRSANSPALLSIGVACAVLGAIVVASALTPPPASGGLPGSRSREVVVQRSDAVCPELRSDPSTESRVAIAAPGTDGQKGSPRSDAELPGRAETPNRAELRELAPRGATRLRLAKRSSASLTLPAKGTARNPRLPDAAMVGIAEGELAAGFGAAFVTRTTRGEVRGLSGGTCVAADTDFWFIGSGAVIGQRGRLYLTNPTSAPALLDVTLFGPNGRISAVAARGLTVAAHAQEVHPLDAWAPTTSRFGIHVHVRQGRIAAALRDHQVRGLDARGIDWVPAAAPPARRVVVPGVPAGKGERRLQVLAPGDADAIVRVRLLAADGPFVPAAADVLEVPAGSVLEVDLTEQLAGKEMAVELTSDVAVTAGLLARTAAAKGQLEDLAYAAAGEALTPDRPGLVPLASAGPPFRVHLTLAAPRGDVAVRVVPLAGGEAAGELVRVTDGTQVAVAVDEASTTTPAIVVVPQPGSEPVLASVVIEETGRGGRLLTAFPVMPGRYAVRIPVAAEDLSTGLAAG